MTGVQTCALPICFPVTIGEQMPSRAKLSGPGNTSQQRSHSARLLLGTPAFPRPLQGTSAKSCTGSSRPRKPLTIVSKASRGLLAQYLAANVPKNSFGFHNNLTRGVRNLSGLYQCFDYSPEFLSSRPAQPPPAGIANQVGGYTKAFRNLPVGLTM